jgi:hypothetical protein
LRFQRAYAREEVKGGRSVCHCAVAGFAVAVLLSLNIAPGASGQQRGCSPRWRNVLSPRLLDGSLESLAAVSADDVWAVGTVGIVGRNRSLAEHWDGRHWRVVKTPNPTPEFAGQRQAELRDVVAVASNDVWAVGSSDAKALENQALIEHWDGRQWKLVSSPALAPRASLWGVAGDSSNDVWAVGTDDKGLLILRWNGSAWRRLSAPSAPALSSVRGVAVLSRNDVWVVGSFPGRPPAPLSLAAHWDGRRWLTAKLPQVPGSLGSLAALSSADIWAVTGAAGTGVVMHWDGVRWRAYPHLSTVGPSSDVTVVSRRDAWLVSPIMHWNGQRWRVVRRPAPQTYVVTITAVSRSDVWAAGYATAPNGPIIEHYSCTPASERLTSAW